MIVFVSGGARSGKSQFAEGRAEALQRFRNGRKVYVATANISDEEMRRRAIDHQASRGGEWETVELPISLNELPALLRERDVILLDCLTVWLSQVLYDQKKRDPISILSSLVEEIKACEADFIFVSNDLNEDVIPDSESVREYIKKLEEVHAYIITVSEEVYQVKASIPIKWRGKEI